MTPRRFGFYLENFGRTFSLVDLRRGALALGGIIGRFRILFWLAARGHDVFLLNHDDGSTVDGVRGIKVERIDAIREAVRGLGAVDLFVFNYGERAAELTALALPTVRAKVMWAGNPFPAQWMLAVDGVKLHRIVCVSRYHREWYRPYPNFHRLEIARMGIDLDVLAGVAPVRRARASVVFVGAPRFTKGFHNVLDAWADVRRAVPEARLRVVGAAQLHDPCAALGWTGLLDRDLEAAHLDPLVGPERDTQARGIELAGLLPMRAVFEELRRATIAVVNCNWTGSFETYCRSAIEAQAAGAPVVGAARGALIENVRHGETGWLVEEARPPALAAAIVRVLTDESLCERMGMAAGDWGQRIGDYALGAGDWESIAARALEDRPAPSPFRLPGDALRAVGYGRARIAARRLLKGARA